MLVNTFCHLTGIGPTIERNLWARGLRCWSDWGGEILPGTSMRIADTLRRGIAESLVWWETRNADAFGRALPAGHAWRLFREFRGNTAYLDIETTGLGGPGDHITTIAVYDGRRVQTYVFGENLHDFPRDIARFDLLVTYNGKCFDAPFIENYFGIRLTRAHIDLRYPLHSLGYTGGLKGCERRLGIDRGELDGVDGFLAVLLWRDYEATGDRRALGTLLAYNVQDVVNLEALMVFAYNAKTAATPFAATHLAESGSPPTPAFTADGDIVTRLRRGLGAAGYPGPLAWRGPQAGPGHAGFTGTASGPRPPAMAEA